MGFFNRKPKQRAKPAISKGIRRGHLKEAQRNARTDQQATDSNTYLISDLETGGWLDQLQTPMARIRSEAVQARKLAEQIDSLSRNEPAQTRKQAVMTDSTTVKPGNVGEKQRRATDKPRAAKVRSTFNPLHPSMELPPEQLIRLLGLESKKIRKQRRAKTGPEQQTPTTTGKSTPPPELERQEATKTTKETEPARSESQQTRSESGRTPPESQRARSARRQREYERATKRNESKNGRSLWLSALAVGLICGIAGAVYLFGMQPDQGTTTKATVPVTSKVNRKPVSSASGKPATKAPTTADKAKQTPAANNDPAWLATIDARKKHLRDGAEQRFEQRLMQAAQKSSIVAAPIAPPQPKAVSTETPVTTVAPEASIPPVAPAAHSETGIGDGTLGGDTANPTADEVTEPLTSTLQTSGNQEFENSSGVQQDEKQPPATTVEPTDQLSDEKASIPPVTDKTDPESAAELF